MREGNEGECNYPVYMQICDCRFKEKLQDVLVNFISHLNR